MNSGPEKDFHHQTDSSSNVNRYRSGSKKTVCGKTIYYRLLKKVQIQGARNPEE